MGSDFEIPSLQSSLLSRRRCALGLLVVGTLVFANNLTGPFTFDDHDAIVNNEVIRGLWPLSRFFVAEPGNLLGHRPVVSWSLALNYAIGGLDVRGYHIANIVIHIACALLLFTVVRYTLLSHRLHHRFRDSANGLSLATALIWMVHPLQSECVNYITQRTESIMALFFLGTLYCAIRAWQAPRRKWWYAAAIVVCAFGMLSKEVMVLAPFIVIFYDCIYLGDSPRQTWRKRWPLYVGLTATSSIVIALFALSPYRSTGFSQGITGWEYGKHQCLILVEYLRLVFWPHPLVHDYGYVQSYALADVWVQAALILTLLASAITLLCFRPTIGFPATACFLILAPTSSFYPIITEVGAERRMYLPLACIVVMLVVGFHTALSYVVSRLAATRGPVIKRLLAGGGLTLAVVLLATVTIQRNRDYHSELRIWQTCIQARPLNHRAHGNLGAAYDKLGQTGLAIECFNTALRLHPMAGAAHHNLGNVMLREGNLDRAELHLRQSIVCRPDYAESFSDLGHVLLAKRKPQAAARAYEQATRLSPDCGSYHFNLSLARLQCGETVAAETALRAAIRINPGFAKAHHQLGALLINSGDDRAAIGHLKAALAVQPEMVTAAVRLAELLATTDDPSLYDPKEACHWAQQAVDISRLAGFEHADLFDTLAMTNAAAGDLLAAIHWQSLAVEIADTDNQDDYVARLKEYEVRSAKTPQGAGDTPAARTPAVSKTTRHHSRARSSKL